MRIYLQTLSAPGIIPRFFHLILEKDLIDGWNVVKESGIQGGAGKITKQHYNSREEAETAITVSRDRQLKRGYRVVFVEGQSAPASGN